MCCKKLNCPPHRFPVEDETFVCEWRGSTCFSSQELVTKEVQPVFTYQRSVCILNITSKNRILNSDIDIYRKLAALLQLASFLCIVAVLMNYHWRGFSLCNQWQWLNTPHPLPPFLSCSYSTINSVNIQSPEYSGAPVQEQVHQKCQKNTTMLTSTNPKIRFMTQICH